ncbi:MAG: hypothetical protein H0W62_11830 [Chitinophagales bacterium]|nr:hypothetical protein [Chitinophagales bacterium]
METIIIQANTKKELKSLEAFLKEHKMKSRTLSTHDKENLVLGRLMQETDYSDTIPTGEFLKKLRS